MDDSDVILDCMGTHDICTYVLCASLYSVYYCNFFNIVLINTLSAIVFLVVLCVLLIVVRHI